MGWGLVAQGCAPKRVGWVGSKGRWEAKAEGSREEVGVKVVQISGCPAGRLELGVGAFPEDVVGGLVRVATPFAGARVG